MFGSGDGGSGAGNRGYGISFGLGMSAIDFERQSSFPWLFIGMLFSTDLWIGGTDNIHICCLKLMSLFFARRARFPDTRYLNSCSGR